MRQVQIWIRFHSRPDSKTRLLILAVVLLLLMPSTIFPQEQKNQQPEIRSYEAYLQHAQDQLAANNPEEAVKNLLKAADILENRDEKEKLSMVYIMVADIYASVGALDKSADYYKKSLQTGIFTDMETKAIAEEKLGDVYFLMEQYDKSLQPYTDATEYHQLTGNEESLRGLLTKMATTHRKAGNFRESLKASERLRQI